MTNKSFLEMSVSEKVEFFVQCQRLLIENHANSTFTCRRSNLKERLSHIKKLASDYKGLCYMDDSICALYNKIIVADPKEVESAIRHYSYKHPDPDYNAISVDFVVFKNLLDCHEFIRLNYDPKLLYVVFVKNNQAKIYSAAKLISEILKIPRV